MKKENRYKATPDLPANSIADTLSFEQYNATQRNYPIENTFIRMFQDVAERYPDSKAIECNGEILTYKELDTRSNLFAGHLLKAGAAVEKTVCVCLDRSINMVAAIIGILKTGAAYVPIDPSFPSERISFIIKDSGAVCLFTESKNSERFSSSKINIISPDNITSEHITKLNKYNGSAPDNLAYIIYTSGSTGQPKGVEILNSSLSNFLYSMQEKPGITSKDIVLSVTTISFDIAGLELFLPLSCGASVIVADRNTTADARHLAECIKNKKPSIMQATPATWNMLLDSGWNNGKGMTILCGGEALSKTLAVKLLQTGANLWNMYGPTETTIWSALCNITEPVSSTPAVGYPIANTKMYILDVNLQHVKPGEQGELYIAGAGLARGYHNRPELTNSKFIYDPFTHSGKNNRMYRTGDLARMQPDGSIVILGRSDFQLKIRGFRIEPEEIEKGLLENEAIYECTVGERTDSTGNKILAAYIVFRKGKAMPVDILYSYLRKKLPEYMIPSKIFFLDALPRLANNKTDRSALAGYNQENTGSQAPRPNLSTQYVPPSNETEKMLAEIWQDVLDIKPIGINDNFSDLGGRSLPAVKILTAIQNRTKIDLQLSVFITSPTISALALLINETLAAKNKINNNNGFKYLVPIKPDGKNPPFFCIHGVGGNVLHYKSFVPYLDKEQPLYGIQCRGVDGLEKPFGNIKEMTAAYIDEIRKVQPHGPYYIGGGSMGGLIAFEMAQQLTHAGNTISLLIMFDSICQKLIKNEPLNHHHYCKYKKTIQLLNSTIYNIRFLNREKLRFYFTFIKRINHSIRCRIEDTYKHCNCLKYLILKKSLPYKLRYWRIEQKNSKISKKYLPKKYYGPITLFRAEYNKVSTDPYLGWETVLYGDIVFYNFPVGHQNMIEYPDVAIKLNELLNKKSK